MATCVRNKIIELEKVNCDIFAKWETIKYRCSEIVKTYATKVAQEKNKLKYSLEKLMQILVSERMIHPNDKDYETMLNQVKNKIKNLENEKVESARFRCSARWEKEVINPPNISSI